MRLMVARKMGLVHPPLESFPSGGNVYNEKLLEYARRDGSALISVPWQGEAGAFPVGAWDLLAWDSLLLDRLRRIAGERIGLLLHYLPSLDPVLDQDRRLALHAVEERAIARADFAVVTGKTVADAVTARWPGKPVFLCEPGIAEVFLRNRPSRADRPVTLLTVAHLLPAKGHERLLEILARLRHLQWHWQVVGDCGASSRTAGTVRRLRDHVAREGLTDRVTFHGALPQEGVAALMATSDLLVSPSMFEAYGMAVAEAAAAGLPVLSHRVGAAEQLIQHGVTGFLAGDWDSFGRYLEILLEDAALRATFQDNLRGVPVRGWEKTFAEFRAACEAMLQ